LQTETEPTGPSCPKVTARSKLVEEATSLVELIVTRSIT